MICGDSSKLQGDLNFAIDQLESKVNLHKTSSPSKVSPDLNIQMQARHARLIIFFFMLKSILFLQLMEFNFQLGYKNRTLCLMDDYIY